MKTDERCGLRRFTTERRIVYGPVRAREKEKGTQTFSAALGTVAYEYDKNGNRTKTGGSIARTGLPQTISSTAYNAANHQTTFGDKTLTYDNNGNLQTIIDSTGTTTYTWHASNQLTGITLGTIPFTPERVKAALT